MLKKSLPGTYRGSSQTGMTDGDRSNWWLTSTEACVLVDADDKTAFSQGRNILTKIYCVCCGGGLFCAHACRAVTNAFHYRVSDILFWICQFNFTFHKTQLNSTHFTHCRQKSNPTEQKSESEEDLDENFENHENDDKKLYDHGSRRY